MLSQELVPEVEQRWELLYGQDLCFTLQFSGTWDCLAQENGGLSPI